MSFTQDWSAKDVANLLSGNGRAKAKKTSRGYMVCCPAHNDRTPSLSLNDGRDGLLYHCFGGCQQQDVRKALRSALGDSDAPVKKKNSEKTRAEVEDQWEAEAFVPEDAEYTRDDFFHFDYGMPTRLWTYHDADTRVAGWVARHDIKVDGAPAKEIVPYAWCVNHKNGDKGIRQRAMKPLRPLYRLPQIIANSKRPVLWVEGEKAVDAALEIFDQWEVTTNQSGGNAVHLTDVAPLYDRDVIIMPDNDSPGFKASAELALRLDGKARIHYLNWPDKWPNGKPYSILPSDDIADHLERGWTKERLKIAVQNGHKLTEKYGFMGESFELIHYDWEKEQKFRQ